MAENDEAKDDMPELPSDYQAFRRSYRWLLLYGPWAFAALGLALIGVGLFADHPSEVAVAALGIGAAMFGAGVLLPRMRGPVEIGSSGVKAVIERVPRAMMLVAVTAKQAAEQAIPADAPDKERRVNDVVEHTVLRHVKDTLAQDFERQAEWRDQKAEEWPDHHARNARAAEGLRGLAEYVRTLPDDDPRLRRLGQVWTSPHPDPGAAYLLLEKYGFSPVGLPDHDSFLTSYADEWSMNSESV
jgi:hypothetical protein